MIDNDLCEGSPEPPGEEEQFPEPWWEARLTEASERTVTAAKLALARLVTRRLTRSEIFLLLRSIDEASHPRAKPPSRTATLAYRERVLDLLEAVYGAWDEFERFADASFANHLASMYESANLQLTLLDESLERPKAGRDLALRVACYELAAASAWEHGDPKYGDLCALLAAVGVPMNVATLRQHVSREVRRRQRPLAKKERVKVRAPKRPRGRPPKPDSLKRKRPGEVKMGLAANLDRLGKGYTWNPEETTDSKRELAARHRRSRGEMVKSSGRSRGSST